MGFRPRCGAFTACPRPALPTGALVLSFCWRRACLGKGASFDNEDLELTAADVPLPAPFAASSVGVALTMLRPACAAEAWAEAVPVLSAKFNSLLLNEADTVTTPGGGLARFTAHILVSGRRLLCCVCERRRAAGAACEAAVNRACTSVLVCHRTHKTWYLHALPIDQAPAGCDDRSASFLLNVQQLALQETIYNMCPVVRQGRALGTQLRTCLGAHADARGCRRMSTTAPLPRGAARDSPLPPRAPLQHAIPDTRNGNADCPASKVPVYLDITDAAWVKDPRYPTVKQCVDPANFDQFNGSMAISYCWGFGQLPTQFSYK
jgi:hypothetical protein